MCLRKGMSPEYIRVVTGHTTADMMMKSVKFDDDSKRVKMSILNDTAQLGVETILDYAIIDEERMRLGLPICDAYFEIFEVGYCLHQRLSRCSRSHPWQFRCLCQVYQTPPNRQTQ